MWQPDVIFYISFFQYYTETGLPGKRLDPNVCGVCGNQIMVMNNEDAIIEETFKLDCNHVYPFIYSWKTDKEILEISKGQSEAINQRTKRTLIFEKLHRKLKIEQHDPHKKTWGELRSSRRVSCCVTVRWHGHHLIWKLCWTYLCVNRYKYELLTKLME